jgi:hypothetical protein
MAICSVAFRESRSTTQTALVLAQATKRREPSLERAMALGCSPTAMSPFSSRLSASKRRTFAPPQRETKRVFPSGAARHVYGSAASATVFTTLRAPTSTAASVRPMTLTA